MLAGFLDPLGYRYCVGIGGLADVQEYDGLAGKPGVAGSLGLGIAHTRHVGYLEAAVGVHYDPGYVRGGLRLVAQAV